jgi:protein SCO1
MLLRRRTFLATTSLLGLALLGCDEEPPLEALFSVPAFELTDQDGANFGSEQLRGRVWVASFLFTSCTQACPLLASQLANARSRVAQHGDNVRFVSISVDPEVDTPERMRAFAERYPGPANWTLLTGSPDDVRRTTERAFFQPAANRVEISGAPGYDMLHGTGVLLVDRDGRCRGRYSTDGAGLDALVHDIERLL